MLPSVQVVRPVHTAMVQAGQVRLVLILAHLAHLAHLVNQARRARQERPLVLVLCRVVNPA